MAGTHPERARPYFTRQAQDGRRVVFGWHPSDTAPTNPLTTPRPASGELIEGIAFASEAAARRFDPGRAWRLLVLVLTVLHLGPFALATRPARAAAPAFVTIQGDQFSLQGQRVVIKGANYYQRNAPWAEMWRQWYGPQVAQEIADGSALLGLNALRILVPYGAPHDWTDDQTGAVNPAFLDELRQMVQIAGDHNLRVIITLFDFYSGWPAAGTPEETANLRYLATILATFRDDDRVLAWDLHNEPDHYWPWRDGHGQAMVIDWLARMAAATRRLDPNHPVTVGLGKYHNHWYVAGPGAPRILDLVDFVSFHAYDATDFPGQVREIKAHTGKPILLEEVGWPTDPTFLNRGFNEEVQLLVYQEALGVIQAEGLSGATPWLLWDIVAGRELRAFTYDGWMGLIRQDGTLKPAGELYATWQVPRLPARVSSSLPLTGSPIPEAERPLYFPETKRSVCAEFRQLWLAQGGLERFGLPLTEPFSWDGQLIQYFERAVMEWHPEGALEPGYEQLSPDEQLRRVVTLRLLGRILTADRQFAPLPPVPSDERRWFFPETGHTLANDFLDYWLRHGGLLQFGYPISEPLEEVSSADGVGRVVQYFERARFESQPTQAGTPHAIQLGNLGREEMQRRGWLR